MDKAIDMYFQDKDVYLSYKGYDYALQIEPNSETPNLLINPELNIKMMIIGWRDQAHIMLLFFWNILLS